MRDTIEMLREAGWASHASQDERFKALEALIRADEREECAKVCEDAPEPDGRDLAERIRNRGNT